MTPLPELVDVARLDDTTFTGRCLAGASGRVFGGQLVAQALRAATLATPQDRPVHSLHSWFLRPGNPASDITFATTALKAGRALTTVRVDCHQGDHIIATATASFHRGEPGTDYQVEAPLATDPELCAAGNVLIPGTNAELRRPVDLRYPDEVSTSAEPAPPRHRTWLRSHADLGEDPSLHASALAYFSDLTLTRTAHMPLRRPGIVRVGASLDHTIWFHRPFRADTWLLFDQHASTYAGARALSHGRMFTTDGVLVASVVQEALIRAQP